MDKPRICKILGVEVNEKFELKYPNSDERLNFKYYITEYGNFMSENGFNAPNICIDTINDRFELIKLPKYTAEQEEIFKALKTLGYNYIVRDSDNTVYAYESKPKKHKYDWQSKDDAYIEIETNKILNQPHLNFINWEDKEPFEIPEV